MIALSKKETKLLEKLIQMKQNSVSLVMKKYLEQLYQNVIYNENYIIAEGDIPIAILAHMDTVFEEYRDKEKPVLYYDKEQGVMFSPQGAGFDDKAGIFLIIKILQQGLRPTVILSTNEEMGCIGAEKMIKDYPKCPIKNIKYLIQLDRRGFKDCVFYDCNNTDFNRYIESFGFITNYGSFTDISVIAPAWGMAAVNLSVGYENEHTYSEILYVPAMLMTYNKVLNMLQAKDIPYFKYISQRKSWFKFNNNDWFEEKPKKVKCNSCGKTFEDWETIPIHFGNNVEYYCSDCSVDSIDWCSKCQNPYKIYKGHNGLCSKCKKIKGIKNDRSRKNKRAV